LLSLSQPYLPRPSYNSAQSFSLLKSAFYFHFHGHPSCNTFPIGKLFFSDRAELQTKQQSGTWQIFGLENRRKISHIIDNDIVSILTLWLAENCFIGGF
jgi:hypothetical protein